MAAVTLFGAYDSVDDWPAVFVRVWLDDALYERVWVDAVECRMFTDNICTVFGVSRTGGSHKLMTRTAEDDSTMDVSETSQVRMRYMSVVPAHTNTPRYTSATADTVRAYVCAHLNDWCTRRVDLLPKSLMRTLTRTMPLADMRALVAGKLDQWLQNAKVRRDKIWRG
jgi:integrator complex subunit 1